MWPDIIVIYDLENTLGHVVYRAAMAFRMTPDLELHRKTVVTFDQSLRLLPPFKMVKNIKRGYK
jgi:hypothetical protein